MNQMPRHFSGRHNQKEGTGIEEERSKQRISYVRNSSGGAVRIYSDTSENKNVDKD